MGKQLIKLLIIPTLLFCLQSPVQASRNLYETFADTYGIAVAKTDISALETRLNTLYQDQMSAKEINTMVAANQDIKTVIDDLNKDIEDRTAGQLKTVDAKKKEIAKTIENGVLDLSVSELSNLIAEHERQEDLEQKLLDEKNALFKLFGATNATYVDLTPIDTEIMKYQSSIDEANRSKVNLGTLSELKRPFNYPVDITSPMGYRVHPISGGVLFHNGVDYAMPTNTELYALFNGTIIEAGWNDGYGNSIKIDCGDGIIVHYAHLNKINVAKDQFVGQNELIGLAGSTGNSTGPHLHLGLFHQENVLSVEDLFND